MRVKSRNAPPNMSGGSSADFILGERMSTDHGVG